MSMADWPQGERPREKLFNKGAASLSDAELLAVMLQTGTRGRTSLDIARDMLSRYGGLIGLLAADPASLIENSGIGAAKAARFVAMKELSQRHMLEGIQPKDILTSSEATRDYLRAKYRDCQSEIFSCLFLNNQHHIVKLEELFRGTIDGAAVYPREVVKRCLYHNAAAVILAHNHPSGIAEPSRADIAITKKLRIALELIDVRVLDHLVIGNSMVVSFAERGLL
ncbi:MAG: DNA repair protein RadC [Gammaproteobacteria bacterium]|nr:DNA repair protein RadC [Gammaproteobacteria bacterium]